MAQFKGIKSSENDDYIYKNISIDLNIEVTSKEFFAAKLQSMVPKPSKLVKLASNHK